MFSKRKYLLTLIAFSYFYLNVIAQVAIIKDEDGFTNVRYKPESTSRVIYKLKTNEVFWFEQEDYYSQSVEWIMISIPKNPFSIECGALDNLTGYIHRSRIQPLNSMKVYNKKDLKFMMKTAPFDEDNKIIDYQNNWVTAINGLYPWGVNGEIPKTMVDSIEMKVDNVDINVPKILIADLYECNTQFVTYKTEQTYFIFQKNGHRLDPYIIVWVIDNNGIKQRFVMDYK